MNHQHFQSVTSRLFELADELSAGCVDEFDAHREELEYEFATLRLALPNH